MKAKSLRHVLAVSFVLVAALPVLAVGLLGLRSLSTSLEREITNKNYLLARSLVGELERFLNEPMNLLVQIRDMTESESIVSSSGLDAYLAALLSHYEFFDMICILDRQGVVTHLAPFDENILGLDMSNQTYYRVARETDKPCWSHTFISPQTRRPTLTLTLPTPGGMVVGHLNLADLNHVIDKVRIGTNGYAAIADGDATTIAHPNRTFVAQRYNIRGLAPARKGLAGKEGTFHYEFQGVEKLGSVAIVPQTRWLVIVTQPVEEALRPVQRVRNIILGGCLAAIALAVMAAVITLRRALRPLSHLEEDARRIAGGDYTCEPPVESYAEIESLNGSFRAMIDAVRTREEALRDSQRTLATLMGNLPGMAYRFPGGGRGAMEFVSQGCANLTGYDPDDLVKDRPTYRDLIHPDDRERVLQEVRGALEQREPYAMVYRIRTASGGEKWVWEQGCGVFAPDNEILSVEGFVTDITGQKRAEEERSALQAQLRQSQKLEAIGQLASGVAHDFNNILTAILGNVELSMGELRDAAEANPFLISAMEQIERSAQRATALTRQLLAFSRRQISQPQILNLNRLLADLDKMLRRLITENIVLETITESELRPVLADAGHLEQVVVNLVVNGADAMPDGGRLTIETSNVELDEGYLATHAEVAAGSYVLLTVSDTGCGMTPETCERIFEPFFTTKPRGKGTGLGLATAYGIVKQSGGHIAVYSEPGRGTTFKIYLPVTEGLSVAADRAPIVAEPLGGNETLLLVEDDRSVGELAAQVLRSVGYTVLTASGGKEALLEVARHREPIGMLITDVIMPDMNGRQLSQALLIERPGLAVLFISGYTSNVIAHHGVLDEGVELLEKPFTRHQLLARVRAVLDKARPASTES
ncbi:MAG: PAS domain-containing protein [Phycisphaerae bacterium]|nr:PAS domain-containing protein [Phycisphaerae bacterium]